MRLAAIYDIHGNLPALEAVLAEIRQAAVDHVVVGGDVLPGPMPQECFERLRGLDVPVRFIHGNCEVAVLAERAGANPRVPEQVRETIRWTARQLSAQDERWIAGWPKTLRLEIDGLGEVLFCHATPRDENECFTRLTPEDRLLPIFDGLGASLVVCGHTHMQFDRRIGKTRVVNAGSVGMPFGESGADWLLLGPDVQLRHTPYDLEAAAARVRDTAYPQAEDFAVRYVLRPPSAEEMLEVFTRVELK
ncbi:MAG TPA: metallophosphoesterase family protein [Thermoanaerobaculia bacterium]|jgi:predicted phosphodiesterase